MKRIAIVVATFCVMFVVSPAQAWQFAPLENFPAPAANAFDVTGTALADGRLVFWNGDTVYFQKQLHVDAFEAVATGYAGDPGFIALTPDGSQLILGEGFGGALYRLSVHAPEDFTPESIVATQSHYDGLFLTQDLLLLDISKPDWSGTELVVLDVSADKAGLKDVAAWMPVVRKPAVEDEDKGLVVEKPDFSYSASLAHDPVADTVYAFDGNAQELRYFDRQALVSAYETGTTLDWDTDGVLVGAPGDFFTSGVGGVMADGLLLVAGAMGFFEPGGIQVVDPVLSDPAQAYVLLVLDPAETQGFYNVIYNPVTAAVIAISDGKAFITREHVQPLPLATGLGLLLTATGLAFLGRRRASRL